MVDSTSYQLLVLLLCVLALGTQAGSHDHDSTDMHHHHDMSTHMPDMNDTNSHNMSTSANTTHDHHGDSSNMHGGHGNHSHDTDMHKNHTMEDGHGNHSDHGDHGDNGDHGDHGDNNDHGGHSVGHSLYFFFSENSIILFRQWTTDSWQTMLGSCFGIGAIAAAYEGLKFFREYLQVSMGNGHDKYSMKPTKNSCCSGFCTCIHLFQTLLHMIQVAVSYGLMMVFMTFNVWLCIAVIIGAGVGYLFFGWKRRHSADTLEHCN